MKRKKINYSEIHLEPAADPALELQINSVEQSEVSEYNKLTPEELNEEQENENTAVRRSNGAIKHPEWLDDFDVGNTGVDDDMILLVVSLFLLRSNNSTTRTSQ